MLMKNLVFKNYFSSFNVRCASSEYGLSVTKTVNYQIHNFDGESLEKSNEQSPSNCEPEYRFNEYGIQMISKSLCNQLFHHCNKEIDQTASEKCLKSLQKFNLGNRKHPFRDVEMELPKLLGNNIEEHFEKIGELESSAYRQIINKLVKRKKLPDMPSKWLEKSGWMKYNIDGSIQKVSYPNEEGLIFDVEVCRAEGSLPTIAVAAGLSSWYVWISESLLSGYKSGKSHSVESLIPLENLNSNSNRIVIGHGISFDRARVREQYCLHRSRLRFLDTLSMHVCISGITSQQKALLKAGFDSDQWTKVTSLNSLSKVHKLYCGSEISKDDREIFIHGSVQDIRNNLQSLISYCAKDVLATYEVLLKLWPLFTSRFPHPVTLAGMLELQSVLVTVNENWNRYIEDSDSTYEDLKLEAKCLLSQTAKETCFLWHNEEYKKDLWMWDQDWSSKPLKIKKKITKKKSETSEDKISFHLVENYAEYLFLQMKDRFAPLLKSGELLYAKRSIMPGYPEWFTKCCEKPSATNPSWIAGPSLLTNSMLVTPKLLRLCWKFAPLHHLRGSGWGYIIPFKTGIPLNKFALPTSEIIKNFKKNPVDLCHCSKNECLGVLEYGFCREDIGSNFGLVKLPHKDGSNFNVGSPLSRDFVQKFSDLHLSSKIDSARRIIEISKMLSYWRNNRDRIESQMLIWLKEETVGRRFGIILPQLIVCGTLTRRAVEPTWMTLSNSQVDRIGSELRGIIQAPPGYCYVGADVDSQELWISSLLGDAFADKQHGCTPFGWMTLNGHKADNTDLHSVTAKAIGISRSDAKVINYARIYGAGQKFAERTLANFNPGLTSAETASKASKMYQMTKGKKMYQLKKGVFPEIKQRIYNKFRAKELCQLHGKDVNDLFELGKWFEGTESEMFNALEEIACKKYPETPFLKCKLSRALEPDVDSQDRHGNTRINWVVQSSAVDFLHLMLVCMKWLMGDSARFSLSFHDEVRYLVREEDKYRAALALHLTNLFVRAFCVSRMGMTDLPLSVSFFSSVEIDKTLRKDPMDDCITASNPHGLTRGYGVPKGETLDIYSTLAKCPSLYCT